MSSAIANSSKQKCYSLESPTLSTQPTGETSKSKEKNDTTNKECCSEYAETPKAGDIKAGAILEDVDFPKTYCRSQTKEMAPEATRPELERCGRSCGGSEGLGQCEIDISPTRGERYQGSCSTSISTTPQIMDKCSKNACCMSHVVCCDSGTQIHSASPASQSLQVTDSASKPAFASEPDNVDLERDLFGTRRITLQIQGMTCAGCETKLFRLLTSLPEVSQVKTSLLLAQAEFVLRPSGSVDAENIASILQKMTGFTCTKMVHVGEELELLVEGNAQDYADCWPLSVIDLTIMNRNRIRVSYNPKAIGVRELLSDPFFQHTKLAPPSLPPLIASGRAHLWKSFYMTLFSAAFTIPVLVLTWAQLPRHDVAYGAVSLALASVVQGVVTGPFYARAIKTLVFSRMVEMDLLIIFSTTTAYIYSIVAYAYLAAGKPLVTGEFFETSTLLVTLIMVGRTMSVFARQRAVESITIESVQTNTAIIIDHNGGEDKEIDSRLLQYHDVFKVLPDMSVVTDGIVMFGESELDESFITGEAVLVPKRRGDSVIAGSVNHSGTLKVEVTRLPCENTIKTIGAMVDEAKSGKPKIQELTDRVASYFVPVILGVTIIVFVVWVAVGKAVRHQSITTNCISAMTYAISVLIVSCPCAIGLAVPMVVVVAGGVGARHGLIFKTAEAIDTARKVSHVIFDKTGTLTQGKLHVVTQEFINAPSSFETSLILGLTTNSKHPVALAVASHLRSSGIEPVTIDHITSHPGKGIEASLKGLSVKAGNPYWLNVQDLPPIRKILASGLSLLCVTIEENLIVVYGLQDRLRPDAIPTIIELRKRGVEISLISGDNNSSVKSIAGQLGISPSNVRSRCTPKQKQEYVKSKLTSNFGKREAIVLFCGDGTNDAPSLAQASIGVHMNEGTEIAASAADAVIMRPSLGGIVTLMDLSKAFHRRVLFDFGWSFVYNLFAVLLAAGAFPHARIPPQYAGLGEVVSVVPVIAIAMQLKWKKF